MKIITETRLIIIYFVLITAVLESCQDDDPSSARAPKNLFSMMIGQELWQPFENKENPCQSTYIANFGYLNADPMYTIYAYNDPKGIENTDSESYLRIRIMDVSDTGIYTLDGSYQNDFDSYFILVSNKAKEKKRYVNNSQKTPLQFHVEEIIPIEGHDARGFKGSFKGVLYNEVNPQDSIVISHGQFKFNVVNYYDHCGI